MNDFSQKQDLAEDIVSRWYSLTRNRDINDKGVITLLKEMIAYQLKTQGSEPLVASQIAYSVISSWETECEGLSVNNDMVIEVLEKKIIEILR